ncbi:N-acetylmuramoyl-L-alanine amidase [bacterium]|nr:N-acetylmuramoyl-L-alanine amidase [bacterium]
MKSFITKFLYIFAFILCFASSVFAADLNINSITYDNSSAFLSINSFDIEDFKFANPPKITIDSEENKAYFDLESAVLRCPQQDLVINSPEISQIAVKQFSTDPNIVRVVIRYNDDFNPKTIQLRKVNSTLFVRFKHPSVQSYYFQQVYTDISNNINKLYESVSIQIPVKVVKNNLMSQINSAFNVGDEEVDYILNKKDLVMPTRYYVDNVEVKTNSIHITGSGALTLTKPLVLSSPTRLVYDIPNATVNPVLRNKEIPLNDVETIKIGQFERETARIVITSNNANNYIPIIYPDSQRIAFIDRKSTTYQALYPAKTTLYSVNDEINDSKTHSVKMVFSKPVIYALDRNQKNIELLLLNADRSPDLNLKSTFLFEGSKISNLKNGGLKVTIPLKSDDILDVHTGVDAKTIRIKIRSNTADLPAAEKESSGIIMPSSMLSRDVNKRFVVIDPGHGGGDHGAIRGDISEKDITLDVSKRVRDLLEKKGYEVFMTREIDETLSLQERVEISENLVPDMFVSIHVNSSNSDAPNGLETHYYKDNSLILAKTVHASMLNHVQANNRGLFKSKFYVINHTTAPAILLEIGFMSNPIERVQLITDFRKQATAKAIVEGIDDYFKQY